MPESILEEVHRRVAERGRLCAEDGTAFRQSIGDTREVIARCREEMLLCRKTMREVDDVLRGGGPERADRPTPPHPVAFAP